MIFRAFLLLVILAAGYLWLSQRTSLHSLLMNNVNPVIEKTENSDIAKLKQQLHELNQQVSQLHVELLQQHSQSQPDIQAVSDKKPPTQPDKGQQLMGLAERMELKALQYGH